MGKIYLIISSIHESEIPVNSHRDIFRDELTTGKCERCSEKQWLYHSNELFDAVKLKIEGFLPQKSDLEELIEINEGNISEIRKLLPTKLPGDFDLFLGYMEKNKNFNAL